MRSGLYNTNRHASILEALNTCKFCCLSLNFLDVTCTYTHREIYSMAAEIALET